MLDWLKKKQRVTKQAPDLPPVTSLPPDAEMGAEELRMGVQKMVVFLQFNPAADDEIIEKILLEGGLSSTQATKLIQFVPIAFTRFLYRSSGVKFCPNYVLVDDRMQPLGHHPIAEVTAYSEAWKFCEQAAAKGAGDDYFHSIAARSGGYEAIQKLIQQGADLSGVITSPPIMFT